MPQGKESLSLTEKKELSLCGKAKRIVTLKGNWI